MTNINTVNLFMYIVIDPVSIYDNYNNLLKSVQLQHGQPLHAPKKGVY